MMSDVEIILGRRLLTQRPCKPWEDHLLAVTWKGLVWIMTSFYFVHTYNYSYINIKKQCSSSVIYERTEPVNLGRDELMKAILYAYYQNPATFSSTI